MRLVHTRAGWRASFLMSALIGVLTVSFLVGRETATQTLSTRPDRGGAAPSAVDVGFCQDMATHHQQAVLMSSLADQRAGPAVKALANSILMGQSQELGVMRGWLRLWDKPAVSSAPMSWISGQASMTGMEETRAANLSSTDVQMPGMATPDQLNELWMKSGKDFDVLFLQLMIRHHQGGITMARYAAVHAKLDALRQAAEAMIYEQAEDIGQMLALLKAYGAAPLPAP